MLVNSQLMLRSRKKSLSVLRIYLYSKKLYAKRYKSISVIFSVLKIFEKKYSNNTLKSIKPFFDN